MSNHSGDRSPFCGTMVRTLSPYRDGRCHCAALVGRQAAFWAAAGSVDVDLSFSSFLECYWADVAEC